MKIKKYGPFRVYHSNQNGFYALAVLVEDKFSAGAIFHEAELTLYVGKHTKRLFKQYSRVRRAWSKVRYHTGMVAAMYWPPGPVYTSNHSCDCDLYHRYWVEEFPSKYAALKSYEQRCEDAEGAESMEFIHEIQFLEMGGDEQTTVFWDQAAEMEGY